MFFIIIVGQTFFSATSLAASSAALFPPVHMCAFLHRQLCIILLARI